MPSLDGKVAIVTGAAHGIGFACAERFAAEGATVVLADIDEEGVQRAVAEISRQGGVAMCHVCDVADRLDQHNLLAITLDTYDRVDVLLNNAAIRHRADFLSLSEEDLDRVLRVNLKAPFLLGQMVARQMVSQFVRDQRACSIINMSSLDAFAVIPDQAAEAISKGALNQLTRSMAVTLGSKGVRVNAIGIGAAHTPGLRSLTGSGREGREKIEAVTPLARIGDPSEVAAIALFLASDDASYIIGQCIVADGGRLALDMPSPWEE